MEYLFVYAPGITQYTVHHLACTVQPWGSTFVRGGVVEYCASENVTSEHILGCP